MKKIFAILLTVIIISGCSSDVLDLANPNAITTQTYWKSESDVLSALAATYNRLVVPEMWSDRGTLIYNGRGDDFFIRNDMQPVYQASTFTNTPDNSEVTGLFREPYRLIFRANQIIQNIESVPDLSTEKKAAYTGESKFLRGLAYFVLVNNFGDVPLILTLPETKEDYFVKQSPQSEVWDHIKLDFKEASEALPVSHSAEFSGRATKGAALAFLGRACLYTKDWDGVIAALTPLTKAPYSYELMENFGDNFVKEKENNKESIFEVQYQDISGLGTGNLSAQMIAPAEVMGWFEAFPTNKLFDAFRKEKTVDGELDPRMYATLIWDYEGAMYYNRPFTDFKTPFPQYKAMFKKYQNYEQDGESVGSAGNAYNTDNNERIMRYDHVLMMLAEAHTMKNQLDEVSGANYYLKQIRKRANLDENKTVGYSQQQMMEEIYHQCMLEFVRESHRFYDLRRWGLLKREMVNSDKEGKEFYEEGKHDYFPIPQDEINTNPEIEQNPYWK